MPIKKWLLITGAAAVAAVAAVGVAAGAAPSIITSEGRKPVASHYTEEVLITSIPIRRTAGTGSTVTRLHIPVEAGDQLKIGTVSRIVQNNRYLVGVGARLEAYDADAATPTFQRVGPWFGDNTDYTPPQSKRHYCPVHLLATYQIPNDWIDGHRVGVRLRIDAHSTAAVSGDVVTLHAPPDSYTAMDIVVWR